MLEKYLQEIGLNEKEAAVYLALLQYDNAAVMDLAKKTNINRSTTYTVLESLAKKGLVSETTVGKKTRYQAESPERLETFVERQKVVLEEHSKRLKDIIPQIKSVQRETGEKPIVKYFEGREGIIAASEEFFRSQESGGTSYLIYSRDLVKDIFTDSERSKYKKMRISKDIRSKSVYTSINGDLVQDNTGDRVVIDGNKYPLKCDIAVDNDLIKISILGEYLSAILIKSKDFADTLKSLVDFVHDKTKKDPTIENQ
ncbi:MAG: BlaI/MecI/CopY family transcriptional regulator [Patescibacteria group bacterium]|nr:BlaI/MecI/CopY family transcriptional regulator [Patescibacteria group bacterium]